MVQECGKNKITAMCIRILTGSSRRDPKILKAQTDTVGKLHAGKSYHQSPGGKPQNPNAFSEGVYIEEQEQDRGPHPCSHLSSQQPVGDGVQGPVKSAGASIIRRLSASQQPMKCAAKPFRLRSGGFFFSRWGREGVL